MIVSHAKKPLPILLKSCWQTLVLMLALLLAPLCLAEITRIYVTDTGAVDKTDPADFFEPLLELALEKTRSTDGDYRLLRNKHGGGIARDRAMVIAGAGIDVMWASVTKEREEQMRLVPVDLLKGYNNYRILLINRDAQPEFSKVKTLADLRSFSVGSGEHWTDGAIMKDNGFNLITTSSYGGLFKMLAARRFHFISRGLNEVEFDTKKYKDFDLVQEESLLLVYDVPIKYCFFVNKDNAKLGDRIERGLKIAQQDGSFDQLFYQIPSFKAAEEILKSSHRTVITIKNTKSN